jgi:hypothetical protein
MPLRRVVVVLLLLIPATSFSVDGRRNVHRKITDAALDFLRSEIVEVIDDANRGEDHGDSFDFPERHFNNCLNRETVGYINHRYRWTVASLAQRRARVAATQLGMALHSAQDFYAHSAWVDPAPIGLGFGRPDSPLIESGVERWSLPGAYERLRDDVVMIQGDPPPGVTIDLPRDGAGRPISAVPIVTMAGGTYRGLMTGTAGPISFATQQCPPVGSDCWSIESVCIRHAEPRNEPDGKEEMRRCIKNTDNPEIYENCFHHDDPRRPRHDAAVAAAVRQTAHEWCRLLHLARADTSGRAVAMLLGLWVEPDSSPHPVGTPCAPRERGSVEVALTTPFTSHDASDHNVAVLYTTDLTRSTRVQYERGKAQWVRLCVAPGDTVLLALWGWKGGPRYDLESQITLGAVMPQPTRSGRCN